MQFEWNKNKAVKNLSKHGVSFEEAKTVFDDPLYVDFYGPEHSESEERYRLFWFLCGNEVYTDSFFDKIVLKVLPHKHFTIP